MVDMHVIYLIPLGCVWMATFGFGFEFEIYWFKMPWFEIFFILKFFVWVFLNNEGFEIHLWNFIVWIPKFGFVFRFKINKIYFLIIIFLILLHFNFKIHEVILIVQLTRWWLNIFSHSQLKKLSCQLLTTKMFYIN